MRWLVLLSTLGLASSAAARPRGGLACVDSYGTVIEGVASPAACKKLGARWAKPGTRSAPADGAPATRAKRASKRGGHRHHYAHRE